MSEIVGMSLSIHVKNCQFCSKNIHIINVSAAFWCVYVLTLKDKYPVVSRVVRNVTT